MSRLDYADIEPQMRGQWHGFILQETGVEPVTEGKGKGIGKPCPICGGSDRAHFKEKDGRVFLFCRGACGNTNSTWGNNTCATPEHLCMEVGGYDFPTLVERCADWLGIQREERNTTRSRTNTVQSNLTPIPKADYQAHNSDNETSEDRIQKHAQSLSLKPQQFERARNPLNAILSVSEILPWHCIGYCQKNALSGDEGEFLAFRNDIDGYNLIIPVFLTSSDRVVMVGAVEIDSNGKVTKHGSCDGGFATIGSPSSDVKIFATDYALCDRLCRQMKAKGYYSSSASAFDRTDATHVFINTNDIEMIDKANAVYKSAPIYIVPVGEFARDCIIESFEFLTYDECQARVKEYEQAQEQGSTVQNFENAHKNAEQQLTEVE